MTHRVAVNPAFRERMVSVFGDDGRRWLDRLPSLVDEYSERWSLRIGPPLALSYNYVAPATRADGTPAVFKCGVVTERSTIRAEMAALQHWGSDGAVLMLEADPDAGAFLLERLSPGQPIVAVDDVESTRIAAGLMRRLWKPVPSQHEFPTLEDWGKAFGQLRERHGGTTGPLPAPLIERGEELYWKLVASQAELIVLHGDLHHFNILSAERAPWLIVDPHGVIGEPAFEVGPWLRNTIGSPSGPHAHLYLLGRPDARSVLARRLSDFSELLGIERERLRDWGIAFGALSACWADEASQHDRAEQALDVATHLCSL